MLIELTVDSEKPEKNGMSKIQNGMNMGKCTYFKRERQIVYLTDKYNKLSNFVKIWAIGVKSLNIPILIIDIVEILCSIDK